MDSYLDRLIKLSLDEDLGSAGDVTTSAVVHPNAKGTAVLLAKEEMVLSGLEAFARTFELVDPRITVRFTGKNGQRTNA